MLLVVVVVEGRSDSLAEFVWKVLARLELDGDYVISGLTALVSEPHISHTNTNTIE